MHLHTREHMFAGLHVQPYNPNWETQKAVEKKADEEEEDWGEMQTYC